MIAMSLLAQHRQDPNRRQKEIKEIEKRMAPQTEQQIFKAVRITKPVADPALESDARHRAVTQKREQRKMAKQVPAVDTE